MLITANTNLPIISQIYPDGQNWFQSTNKFTSTASSPAGIRTASISLILNGVNVSPDSTFTVRQLPGSQLCEVTPEYRYTAVLSVRASQSRTEPAQHVLYASGGGIIENSVPFRTCERYDYTPHAIRREVCYGDWDGGLPMPLASVTERRQYNRYSGVTSHN